MNRGPLVWLLVLLSLLWGSPWTHAETGPGSRVYLHNRPVEGRWRGSEFYIPARSLSDYLDPEELARVVLDTPNQVLRVGEQTLPYDGRLVPVMALARALGMRRVDSQGFVDFVKVDESGSTPRREAAPSGRRGEYKVAAARLEKVFKVMPPVNDPVCCARIQAIGQKVAHFSPLGNINWRFVLVRQSVPNAACVGEGHVFVTTGLMDLGISDDELAGVLGHEIAHGVRRHVFRRVDMARELTGLLRDYTVLRDRLASGGPVSVELRGQVEDYERRRASLQYRLDHEIFYSQVDEEDADVLGMRYAVLAGYSVDGLDECLRKLRRFFVETFGSAVLDDDLTHPPIKRRLEILEKARRDGGF